ncbi:28 kda heat-and acid-stable phospho [Plasmopara halstedii]|uniref:28 kDa heat-and acid-stable phospho n=1 Tax=Plasmopara halstedii TaxID=4781 RepID=A0A0P1A543_PLAHL|nr:28 kda heat-and acid-stable phospho [Plasmopara halstedii]CEG35666.1 28 kda heat-and acid-stable phospho [Plasmopara halstedii]|eukprot:XP_024572035.1 28 kda heat-and acid-stable phospho [Plasmopara halstedii]
MRDAGKPGGKPGGAGGKGRKKREKGGTRKFVTSLEEMTLRDEQEEQKRKTRGDDMAFERVQTNSLFGFSNSADGPVLQQEKKKVGFAAVAKTQNPNAKKTANKVMKAKDMDENAAPQQLSRREREAIEKERAAAYYLKKHLAGETDEAKKDLARLAEVKRRREEAEQRKKEEEEAAAEREKSKKSVQVKDDDEPLDARAIKALKPAVLKEKLKERDLSTQGQKKELIQRLIDYENERAL